MNWSSVANNQTFSFNTLQNAVTNGYFTAKTAIPVSARIVTAQAASDYVFIQPIAKPTNQLVVKSDMVATPGTSTWTGAFVSDTGQYQTVINTTTGYLWDSIDYGASWTQNTGAGALGWGHISISGNGVYRIAATSTNRYVSTNSGVSWTNAISGSGTGTAITDNGETMYVVTYGGSVQKSTNYGASFSQITSLGQNAWQFPSVSSAGQYVLVPDSNYAFSMKRSADYGVNWASTGPAPGDSFKPSAMSDSGQYQIAGPYGGIGAHVSSNYGVSFTGLSFGAGFVKYFSSAAMYASGEFMLIADNYLNGDVTDNGFIWRSINFGASFSKITSLGRADWQGVGFGGQYALATEPGAVYRSTDYGNSWTQVL